jgi:hypothetical protein
MDPNQAYSAAEVERMMKLQDVLQGHPCYDTDAVSFLDALFNSCGVVRERDHCWSKHHCHNDLTDLGTALPCAS